MPDRTELQQTLKQALEEHRSISSHYGVHCICNGWKWSPEHSWHDHLAAVVLSLPGIAVVDRSQLHSAISAGIRSYAGGEGDAYSYHGDGSAKEAIYRLEQEADNIASYIFTSNVLANAEEEQDLKQRGGGR